MFHANNVLAHVPDLNGFVAGIRTILRPDGVAVIEVPYVRDMIDACEFDTIYHEHLCYFSLSALVPLLARHGLAVVDVERLPIHGGSLRVWAAHAGTREPALRVQQTLRSRVRGRLGPRARGSPISASVSAVSGRISEPCSPD